MAHRKVVDEIDQHATRQECATQGDERHGPQPEGRPQNESDDDQNRSHAGSESKRQRVAGSGIRIKPTKSLHVQVRLGSSTTACHLQDPLLARDRSPESRMPHDPDRFRMTVTVVRRVSTLAHRCADPEVERRRSDKDPIRAGRGRDRGAAVARQSRSVPPCDYRLMLPTNLFVTNMFAVVRP